MATTIKLKSPEELGPAFRRLARAMDRGAVKSLQRTARWGATEAVRVSARSNPRPRATGTYERSFVVTKLDDGAVLSNSSGHARFVEVGRGAGRQPPVQDIVDWVVAKKLGQAGDPATRALAFRIARKIGRRGTQGRYVMKRVLPGLRKRLALELILEMRRAFERAK